MSSYLGPYRHLAFILVVVSPFSRRVGLYADETLCVVASWLLLLCIRGMSRVWTYVDVCTLWQVVGFINLKPGSS